MPETISDEVARAALGITDTTLARQAGISPRTLRAILDPTSARRFGRPTLNKLDGPLGWPSGRAWAIYSGQSRAGRDSADSIARQMAMISARLDALEERPSWAKELIDGCVRLSPADRDQVLNLVRRLGSG
jgi:hypothetical protein